MTKLRRKDRRDSQNESDSMKLESKLSLAEVQASNRKATSVMNDAQYTSDLQGDLHAQAQHQTWRTSRLTQAPLTPPTTAQDSAYAITNSHRDIHLPKLSTNTPPYSPVISTVVDQDYELNDASYKYALPETIKYIRSSSPSCDNDSAVRVKSHPVVPLPPSSWRNHVGIGKDRSRSNSTSRERSIARDSGADAMTLNSDQSRSRRTSWNVWSWSRNRSRSSSRHREENQDTREDDKWLAPNSQDGYPVERKSRASWISRRDLPTFRGRRTSDADSGQSLAKIAVGNVVLAQDPSTPQTTTQTPGTELINWKDAQIDQNVVRHHDSNQLVNINNSAASQDRHRHNDSLLDQADAVVRIVPEFSALISRDSTTDVKKETESFINQSGDVIVSHAEPVISRTNTPTESEIVRFWSLRRKVPRVSSRRSIGITAGCLPSMSVPSLRLGTPTFFEAENQSTDAVNNSPDATPAQSGQVIGTAQTVSTQISLPTEQPVNRVIDVPLSQSEHKMPRNITLAADWSPVVPAGESISPEDRLLAEPKIPLTDDNYQWHGTYSNPPTSDHSWNKRQTVTRYVMSALKWDRNSAKTNEVSDSVSDIPTLTSSEGSTFTPDSRSSFSSEGAKMLFESSNPMDRQALRAFRNHPARRKQPKTIPTPFVDTRAVAERLAKLHADVDVKSSSRSSKSVTISDPERSPTRLRKPRPKSRVISAHSKNQLRSAMKKSVYEDTTETDYEPSYYETINVTGAPLSPRTYNQSKSSRSYFPDTEIQPRKSSYRASSSSRKNRPHPLRTSMIAESPLESAEYELELEERASKKDSPRADLSRIQSQENSVSNLTALPTTSVSADDTQSANSQSTTWRFAQIQTHRQRAIQDKKLGYLSERDYIDSRAPSVAKPGLDTKESTDQSVTLDKPTYLISSSEHRPLSTSPSLSNMKVKRTIQPQTYITGPNSKIAKENSQNINKNLNIIEQNLYKPTDLESSFPSPPSNPSFSTSSDSSISTSPNRLSSKPTRPNQSHPTNYSSIDTRRLGVSVEGRSLTPISLSSRRNINSTITNTPASVSVGGTATNPQRIMRSEDRMQRLRTEMKKVRLAEEERRRRNNLLMMI